jgi:hypothetical protein
MACQIARMEAKNNACFSFAATHEEAKPFVRLIPI